MSILEKKLKQKNYEISQMKKVLLSNNQQIKFLSALKDSNSKTIKDNCYLGKKRLFTIQKVDEKFPRGRKTKGDNSERKNNKYIERNYIKKGKNNAYKSIIYTINKKINYRRKILALREKKENKKEIENENEKENEKENEENVVEESTYIEENNNNDKTKSFETNSKNVSNKSTSKNQKVNNKSESSNKNVKKKPTKKKPGANQGYDQLNGIMNGNSMYEEEGSLSHKESEDLKEEHKENEVKKEEEHKEDKKEEPKVKKK